MGRSKKVRNEPSDLIIEVTKLCSSIGPSTMPRITGATGKPFAHHWVENGLVNLQGEKMSKSARHFYSIEDAARDFDPEVIRFYLQSTHYRSPIEWNEDRLREAGVAYARLREALAKVGVDGAEGRGEGRGGEAANGGPPAGSALAAEVSEIAREFEESLDDDFNTAKAQGHLFDIAKSINRVSDSADAAANRSALLFAARKLRQLGDVIGLFWRAKAADEEVPEEVKALVRQRDESRVQKLWRRADELRDEISALGYVLEDSKEGTRARRKT